MRRLVSVLAVLLLAAALPVSVPAQGDGASADVPWWDDGWHFRVPVEVSLEIDSPIDGQPVSQSGQDYPVELEVDFKRAVSQFVPITRVDATLDEGSIRVVEHKPKETGGFEIREVPSRFLPGVWYQGTAPLDYDKEFQVSASTFGTVRFAMPGFTAPDQVRTFHVYFDLEQFGQKDPEPYTPTQLGRLDSLYWKQPAQEFYGRMIGAETTYSNYRSTIVPVATQDDTRYQIWDAVTGQPWFDEPRIIHTYEAGRFDDFQRPSGRGLGDQFVVRADKPIVVYHGGFHDKGDKPGYWELATSGGLAGTDFWIHSLWLNGMTIDFYLIAGDQDATVSIREMQSGEEVLVHTAEVPANSYRVWQNTDANTVWHVTSTAPIMIQRPGTQTYQQLPALGGAPVGEVHFGAHSGHIGRSGGHGDTPEEAELHIIGFEASDVDVYTLPSQPGEGVDLWSSFEHGKAFDGEIQVFDSPAPVMKSVSGAPTVSFGSARTDGSQQPPGDILFLGGKDAQEFYLHVPPAGLCGCAGAIAFPFYAETHVEVERWEDGAWTTSKTVQLAPGTENPRLLLFETGPTRILSDKPISVQMNTNPWHESTSSSRGVFGDILAGRVMPASTQSGEPEYQGCIPGVFDRSAPGAPSPSLRYVSEGGNGVFPLGVRNLASVEGQSVEVGYAVDLIMDEARREALGWQVAMEPDDGSDRSASLVQDGTAAVPVDVTVTTDADSDLDDMLSVRVEAWCSDAPDFVFAYELRTIIKADRGVDVEHLDPADQIRVVQPGDTLTIPMRVTSLANLEDGYALSVRNPLAAIGWEATLDAEGVTLAPGASDDVELQVTAPGQDVSAIARIAVRAASQSDPNEYDEAITEFRINPRYAVELDALETERRVQPGDEATYTLFVQNNGNSEHDINLTFSGALPEGWAVAPPWKLLDRVGIGETRVVVVSIQTPEAARPHVPRTVQVSATSIGVDRQEFVAQRSLDLVTTVEQVHELVVPATAPGGIVDQRRVLTTEVDVSNLGNGDEPLGLRIGQGTPPGWDVRIADASGQDVPLSTAGIVLAPGDTERLELRIQAPRAALAGDYVVILEVAGSDPDSEPARIQIPVTIPEFALLEAHADPPILKTTPGQSRDFSIVVSNLGNIKESYTLEVVEDGWGWEVFPASMELLPTQTEANEFTVSLVPPADLPASVQEKHFTMRIQSSSGAQANVDVLLEIVRPDLSLEPAEAFDAKVAADGFARFRVNVRNDGDAQADRAVVRLLVNGEPVGQPEVLQKIPNGGSKLAVFAVPASALGPGTHSVQFVVDPDSGISESDEENNVLQAFVDVEKGVDSRVWLFAGLGTLAAAGAIGGAFWAWRVRRP